MTKSTLINAVLFQALWFGCVLGGGVYQSLWPGVLALVLLIFSLSKSPVMRLDVLLVMVALPVGWLLDTTWIRLGVLDYGATQFAPAWILIMWMGVALTINHSLTLLRDRALLGSLVVAACAPLSYVAGARLGAVQVPDYPALWQVSLTWGLLFFVLFSLAQRNLARWSTTA